MAAGRLLAAVALTSLIKTKEHFLARTLVNPMGTVANAFQDTAKEMVEECDAGKAFRRHFT